MSDYMRDVGGTRITRLTAGQGDPPGEIEIGSDRWRELVEDCRAKDADRNWRLGDAALVIFPTVVQGKNSNGAFLLEQFAAEIEVCSYDALREYRRTAHRWPPERREPTVTFRTHRELNGRPDRFDLIKPGMTFNDAVLAMGGSLRGRTANPEPTLISVRVEITEIRRRYMNVLSTITSLELSDDDRNTILADLAAVDEVADQCRKVLAGMGLDDALAAILEEA